MAGDRLSTSVSLTDGARALVMAQAAEKVYRSGAEAEARVSVHLSAGPGCWLEWLPRETIVFERARLRRDSALDMDPGAAVLAGEILVFGRRAHGETLSAGLIRNAWRVRIGGRLVWADALHMEGDLTRHRLAAAGLDGAEALATVIAHLPDPADGGRLADGCPARPTGCTRGGSRRHNLCEWIADLSYTRARRRPVARRLRRRLGAVAPGWRRMA